MKKIDAILEKVLEKSKPTNAEVKELNTLLDNFLKKLRKKINSSKLSVEIFVGGSFAKNTIIKKKKYDADVFLRFDKKHSKEVSKLTEKLLLDFKKEKIHGSRDYFKVNINKYFFIEIVPVLKVRNPKEAENITDLSYSHVNYIRKKVKNKKLLNDIILAKTFCHANNCYGAESYIKGFSGYSLELLVHHYKGFLPFVKAMAKVNEKLVIDIEKHFKNKQQILMDVNSSKLQSPIVLIDPTYKQRNALAGLSIETLKRFQKACKNFLKSPNEKAFEQKKTDLKKIKSNAKMKGFEFINIEIRTEKQKGNVAGSKLFKFNNHLQDEISKLFELKNKGFNYNDGKAARCFFVVKKRKELIFKGPRLKDKKNIKAFKKRHKNTFTKSGRIHAREKINLNIKRFIASWKEKNKKKIKEMSIKDLLIIVP